MKISLSLLQTFLDIDLSIQDIADALVLLGIEVDGIENEKTSFSNVVVGKILSSEKHPYADRLSLAKVSDGKEIFSIVCGASNCKEGLKVPLAKIGAKLKDDEGNLFTIKKSKLRKIDSFGMLCTASELHLFDEKDQLLELPDTFQEGEDLAISLLDPIFEVSLTPNLGHCASALGIARELSAFLQKPMRKLHPDIQLENIPTNVKIEVSNKDLCPGYACRLIENVKVAPSPFWLKKSLLQCGIRSVNNIVDVTNFVMLELGQPMHAFDFDRLEKGIIRIMENPTKQSLQALDGNTYTADKNSLMVFDAKKPIAIAGVIGLDNSSVSDQTTNILLEAAQFDPISVRKTSKALNLRTESSQRFEKAIDPKLAALAIDRATELIQSFSTSKAYLAVDYKTPLQPKEIILRKDRVQSISGIHLSLNEISDILQRLSFSVTAVDTDRLKVSVPSFRNDITQEIDLIEEVIRIYGYNQIEKKSPLYTSSTILHSPMYLLETFIRKKLIEQNLQEVLNVDLISNDLADLFKEANLKARDYIKVLHSKSIEYSILRPSLLPSFLQNIKYNVDRKNMDLSFFEIGKIHFRENDKLTEQTMASIALTGQSYPSSWSADKRQVDFFDLKGLLENLLETLSLKTTQFSESNHPNFHPARQANLWIESENIGAMGELHPDLLKSFDIKQRVYFAEIHLSPLLKHLKTHRKMTRLAQYPSSERDWTLPLDKKLPVAKVLEAIEENRPPTLEKISVLDVYELRDQKNVTFRFVYRDLDRTLSYQEIEDTHSYLKEKISEHLKIAKQI